MLRRVLIANRGEIAVRIIRACHEEGIEAVSVYSEADRGSPHVAAADLAIEIGPAAAAASYLKTDRILDAAKRSGSDAIHPGYGFLAERAAFAEAVVAEGVVFVGPPASAIRAMGEKTEARRRMRAAGVAIVPGTVEPVTDLDDATRAAAEVGYPLLLKAAAGGGGKGMRRVDEPGALGAALEQATSESRSAFGDGAVYLERLIERPRHVELQVLADRFGNVIHLGERECSVQRRHQKLIEEAPSPVVDLDLRLAMGKAAVQAARSVNYVGAGTVEFLLEPGGRFYFLEMNTRIQVEHPVTEVVYGVDLVREQLRIAGGEPMTPSGRPMRPRGHAIECRITSEDPFDGFLPATGRIDYLRVPGGPGVRWDGGIEVGSEVGLHYDPLLAKLITWGESRDRAIQRMRRALDELVIVGVQTSQPFHRRVMRERTFVEGHYDIEYLDQVAVGLLTPEPEESDLESIAIAVALAEDSERNARVPTVLDVKAVEGSAWLRAARLGGLR